MTPGKELFAYSEKKVWVLYWSFLDIGMAALSNENAWFTWSVVRTQIAKKQIAGGMGQILNAFNKMAFDLNDGGDIRDGIRLNVVPTGAADSPAESAHAPAGSAEGSSLVWCKIQLPLRRLSAGREYRRTSVAHVASTL